MHAAYTPWFVIYRLVDLLSVLWSVVSDSENEEANFNVALSLEADKFEDIDYDLIEECDKAIAKDKVEHFRKLKSGETKHYHIPMTDKEGNQLTYYNTKLLKCEVTRYFVSDDIMVMS